MDKNIKADKRIYLKNAKAIYAAQDGQFDVGMDGITITDERKQQVDFSAPYMNVEQGFLVRAGASIAEASAVDVAGVRVGILEKSSLDAHLSKTLKNATIVRAKTLAENFGTLDGDKTDLVAATKPALFGAAASRPGTRLIDGGLPSDPVGMAVPKGRDAAASAQVGRFVEEAKASGLVQSAIERAGLRGVTVAPAR